MAPKSIAAGATTTSTDDAKKSPIEEASAKKEGTPTKDKQGEGKYLKCFLKAKNDRMVHTLFGFAYRYSNQWIKKYFFLRLILMGVTI